MKIRKGNVWEKSFKDCPTQKAMWKPTCLSAWGFVKKSTKTKNWQFWDGEFDSKLVVPFKYAGLILEIVGSVQKR